MAPGHASDVDALGIVADYQPVKARLWIIRTGENGKVPLTIGTQIHAGDQLAQLPADGMVLITNAHGAITRFNGPGTRLPLVLPEGPPLGVIGRVLGTLHGYFGEPYRTSRLAATQGANDCARSDAIVVPLFSERAAIVAGTRDLRFAWTGGCAPFTVVVRDAGGRELGRQETTTRAARFREITLEAGSARIEIAGGAHYTQITLDIVPELPAFPEGLAGETGPVAALARAWWLAEYDAGRWKFESFDLLAPQIRAKDPLAGKLGDVLLWGMGGVPP